MYGVAYSLCVRSRSPKCIRAILESSVFWPVDCDRADCQMVNFRIVNLISIGEIHLLDRNND